MWRSRPIPAADLDDQCAIHAFIRVRGRRPTREELARWRQVGPPADTSPPARASSGGTVVVAARARRGIARLMARL